METFKAVVNPKYENLSGFITTLPMQYEKAGNVIYSDRNEIKLFKINNEVVVIKHFKKISPFNKFFFTLLRVTKSKNAYRHSLVLLSKGISTPEPIGYIDCYKNHFIEKSFLVTQYTDYTSFDTTYEIPVEESALLLREFAGFAYRLHCNGIFPGDFNRTNILFKKSDDKFDFQLIDINRMRFHSFSVKRGAKNFQRLYMPVEKLGIVADEYARLSGRDSFEILEMMVHFRHQFLMHWVFKDFMKKLFKRGNK